MLPVCGCLQWKEEERLAQTKMSVSAVVLRAILETIHFLLWLRQLLRVLFVNTKTVLGDLIRHKDKSLCSIQADAKQLDKVPHHLAIVFQESELCLESIARLLCWSFAAGIQYTSIYDPRGEQLI